MTRKERLRLEIAALEWAAQLVQERRGNGRNGRDHRWKVVGEIAEAIHAEIEQRKCKQ